ncbi:uncharacterized protein LOC135209276 [Macrobrachium nipponense]|uniref:uncharacterized protein LOC135209276 n=1 Tax=Macrobrachium nipponense TaxID=159736 RepID=UPI0030C7F4C3
MKKKNCHKFAALEVQVIHIYERHCLLIHKTSYLESSLKMKSPRYVIYPQKELDKESKAVFIARNTQANLCSSCMNQLRYGKWHGKCTCGRYRFIDPKSSKKAFPPKEPGPMAPSVHQKDTKTNLSRRPRTGPAPAKADSVTTIILDLASGPSTGPAPDKPLSGLLTKQEDDDETDLPWRPSTGRAPDKSDSGLLTKQEDDDETDLPWRPSTGRAPDKSDSGLLTKQEDDDKTDLPWHPSTGRAPAKYDSGLLTKQEDDDETDLPWRRSTEDTQAKPRSTVSSSSSAVSRAPVPLSPLDERRQFQAQEEYASASKWFTFRWYFQLVIELSALGRDAGKMLSWFLRNVTRICLSVFSKSLSVLLLVIIACVLWMLVLGSKRLPFGILRVNINV